jgi:hypothetical protein
MAFDKSEWGNPKKTVHARLADNTMACRREATHASGWRFSDALADVTCKRCKRILRAKDAELANTRRDVLQGQFVERYTDIVIDDARNCTDYHAEIRSLVRRLADRMSDAELRAWLKEHFD